MNTALPALSTGLALGMLYAYYGGGINIFLLLCIFISIISSFFYFKNKKRGGLFVGKGIVVCIIFLFTGLGLGIVRAQVDYKINTYKNNYYKVKQDVILSGSFYKIVSDISYKDNLQKFTVQEVALDGEGKLTYKSSFKVLVFTSLSNPYEYADILKLEGVAKEPGVIYANPNTSTDSFDYREYLYLRNIDYVYNLGRVEKVDGASFKVSNYDLLKKSLYKFKWSMAHNLEKSIPSPESGLAAGMILGVDGLMGKSAESNLKSVGLSHIVVLSGYNLIVIVAFVFYILKYVPWVLRIVLATVFVALFTLAVDDSSASLWRALIMTCVSMIGLLGFRHVSSRVTIWYAFILIIMLSPFSLIHDVSLHLSMLACLGLIYYSPLVKSLFEKVANNFSLKRHFVLEEVVAASLAVYLLTAPYIAYNFNNVNLMSFIYNVFISLITPIMMALSFITSLLYYASPLFATILGYLDYILLHTVLLIASGSTSAPIYSQVVVKSYFSMSILAVVAIYFLYFLAYFTMFGLMKRK